MEDSLQKFMGEFASLMKIKTNATKAVIKIIALSRVNKSLRSKVHSAVKIAAASSLELLKKLTETAKRDGKMPTLDSRYKLMTLTELPGMIELQNSTPLDKENHWDQIDQFFCAILSYVGDRKSRLEAAKRTLNDFIGTVYTDCDLMLSEYENLWDICCDLFRGPIETDFDKIQRLLQKCPMQVKAAYVIYMAAPVNKCDELLMTWDDFSSKLQIVWEISTDTAQMFLSLGISNETTRLQVNQAVPIVPTAPSIQKPTSDTPDAQQGSHDLKELTLHCKNCDSDFNFSVSH